MRKYRVKVDSVTGKTQTFVRGSYVNQDQLPEGVAFDLEKKGILEFVTELMEPEDLTPKAEPKMSDFTRQGLIEILKQAGIKFSNNSSKVELYNKWKIEVHHR